MPAKHRIVLPRRPFDAVRAMPDTEQRNLRVAMKRANTISASPHAEHLAQNRRIGADHRRCNAIEFPLHGSMIALVLGEAKRPKPSPRMARPVLMTAMPVSAVIKENRKRPSRDRAIPRDASFQGSKRSESLPAMGVKIAMTMGCATRIRPADCGSRPLIYWSDRLSRKTTAKGRAEVDQGGQMERAKVFF